MNIRYPLYEGVYRILTEEQASGRNATCISPERLLHPEQMLTPSEEETFFIPTFSEKASVHKLVHFNRAATGNYPKELKQRD